MKFWRVVLWVSLLVATGGANANAQDPGKKLRGVTSVYLATDVTRETESTCGVRASDLRKAVTTPLAGQEFTLRENAQTTLYINTITLVPRDRLCVTTIQARVYANQLVQVEATGQRLFTAVDLWQDTYMLAGDKSDHAARVHGAVEEMARKLVIDWARDQK